MTKPVISTTDLATKLYQLIATELPFRPKCSVSEDKLVMEAIFLQIFMIDLASYIYAANRAVRSTTLDIFWDFVDGTGLHSETLTNRMATYTGAAKRDNLKATIVELGSHFAFLCFAQANAAVIELGEKIASTIMIQVKNLFESLEITSS